MANILQSDGEAPEISGEDREALRHLSRRWPVRALILIGTVPGNLAVVIPRPQLAAIDAELGSGPAGDLLVKMILTIVGFSIVVSSPFIGMAIRAFGYRAVLGWGLLLFVGAGAAPFFLAYLPALVASRALLGVAMAAVQIGTVALAGELYGATERARMIGLMTAASALSAVVMGPLSGAAGEWGWRVSFLLYGVLTPFILFAWFGLPAGLFPHGPAARSAGGWSRSSFPFWLIVLGILGGICMTLPAVFLTLKFKEIGVTSSAVIGLSFLAVSIPEVIAAGLYGPLRRRVSSLALGLAGFALAALGLGLAAFTRDYPAMLIALCLSGMSIAWIFSFIAERAASDGSQRARQVGLMFSAIYLSAIGGTLAFEPIFLVSGASGVLWTLTGGACAAILFLVAEKSWRRRRGA